MTLTVLGLGAMGTALTRAWLAAGHHVTVWNRTPARAERLAAEGATVAATPAEAVAANRLVVTCLLDHASVVDVLDGTDLAGRDLVDLTTGTPAQARDRAEWAAGRGARYVDGGIMAVPPMIGVPDSGAYVFYSGSVDLFAEHERTLAVPAGAKWVGDDPGHAALHDVALLGGMTGLFAGVTHAFALVHGEKDIDTGEFATLLVDWLAACLPFTQRMAQRIVTGDYTSDVTSNLAMQVTANRTMVDTAVDQGVRPDLITPYLDLSARGVAEGQGAEDGARLIELLRR
ncbi:NAD(P)-dependent oxidoreductase [Saccharothrix violaceirubra]|uniref:3-hydroxyisobutyrate dehydrogenase-like beta-hydroxyacid dehydrogenase n=1 Tax=Saccharothrix violaceirubra TaxID=413306 RepID=A0A7W7WX30_9PSEU|nr:NAD(P)-binding domain-containing protein [Saccharothrix violaceirubra]MBB4966980.1 3-hydroxyisobutyrate dehydrogenase-like beta-hydroxyacid dehydrogenase [Saccharothrix violaceirubra]